MRLYRVHRFACGFVKTVQGWELLAAGETTLSAVFFFPLSSWSQGCMVKRHTVGRRAFRRQPHLELRDYGGLVADLLVELV